MIAAEKWHEYQCNYSKYGFDMKPCEPKKYRDEKKDSIFLITKKDKAMLLLSTVMVGILCISMILLTAYSTSINYHLNEATQQNLAIQTEIENLSLEIEKVNNLATIEEKAFALGMTYPTTSQFVYMNDDTPEIKDFALLLKENAYQ